MIRRASLFLIALSLTACAPAVQTAAPVDEPGVTPLAQQSTLDQARARWRAAGITSYRVHVERSCFCLGREPVDVEVRSGAVTSVRITETGAEAPREQWELRPSVDALFARMEAALRAGTEVRAEYHPTLGYPTVAVIGTLANDAGTQYSYSNVTPLR